MHTTKADGTPYYPSRSTQPKSQVVCRFYPNCNNINCPYIHQTTKDETSPKLNPASAMKWIAPKAHISDRKFAVNAAVEAPVSIEK